MKRTEDVIPHSHGGGREATRGSRRELAHTQRGRKRGRARSMVERPQLRPMAWSSSASPTGLSEALPCDVSPRRCCSRAAAKRKRRPPAPHRHPTHRSTRSSVPVSCLSLWCTPGRLPRGCSQVTGTGTPHRESRLDRWVVAGLPAGRLAARARPLVSLGVAVTCCCSVRCVSAAPAGSGLRLRASRAPSPQTPGTRSAFSARPQDRDTVDQHEEMGHRTATGAATVVSCRRHAEVAERSVATRR